MKPLIPYVGMNDYVKESFDFIGVESSGHNRLKDLFAKAATTERCNFLGTIYENYDGNVLTEKQALHLISLVEKADDLIDIVSDYYEFADTTSVVEAVPLMFTVLGESVLSREDICNSFHRNSIYNDQSDKRYDFLESKKTSNVQNKCKEVYESIQSNYDNYISGEDSSFDCYDESTFYSQIPSLAHLVVESINADMYRSITTPEDASVEKGFCLKAFKEFNIGAMCPEAPLTGSGEPDMDNTDILDMLKSDDVLFDRAENLPEKYPINDICADNCVEAAFDMLVEDNFFTVFEGAIPKNNPTFDGEVKKLFAKIKSAVDLGGAASDDDYLKGRLNVTKNRYTFQFKDKPPIDEKQIRNAIMMLKFVPNKQNNKIIDYSKDLNGEMNLHLQFDDMSSGIQISYTMNKKEENKDTTESYEEVGTVNKARVADMFNKIFESVAYGNTDEFGKLNSYQVPNYLAVEAINQSPITSGITKELISYTESPDHEDYDLMYRAKMIFESVIESRYGCYVVLNDADMMLEAEDEHSKDIDSDIKPIIDILNKLGYRTKYSCSGHYKSRISEDNKDDGVYNGKLYTTARITFDKKYNFKIIPKGWYQNPNSDVTSIYVEPLRYNPKDGSPDEAFKKWKEGYMTSLKAWVEDLDESKNHNSSDMVEATINEIESYGNAILNSYKTHNVTTESLMHELETL